MARGASKLDRLNRRRNPPGTPPGTITVDPSMPKPQLRLTVLRASGPENIDPSLLTETFATMAEGDLLSLEVNGLGDAELLKKIAATFSLHNLAVEDVVNLHQRPKVENYESSCYIVLEIPDLQQQRCRQLSIFVGTNYVLAFTEQSELASQLVRQRVTKGFSRIRSEGADYLAYVIIDTVIDLYFPVLEGIGERLELLETRISSMRLRGTLKELHALKRRLIYLRRIIWPTREALNAMLRRENALIDSETQLHLRDCYDHTVQLLDLIETYRELASDLTDMHLSQTSLRMNEVMKVLTVISTIFMPLNFIAAIYGMNFDTSHPWNMPELGWPHGYIFALGIMGLTALGLLIFIWRKGWLGKPER